ncbi:MAG: hypothetical protein AAFX09_08720 [Pseudomonadota bacterium]
MTTVRPLSLIIVLLAGLLALKGVSLGFGAADLFSAPAQAAQAADQPTAEAPQDASLGEERAADPAAQAVEPEPEPVSLPPAPPSRLGDTRAELELLNALAERRRGLDRREGELDTREQLIDIAEQRVEDRIAALQELQSEVQSLLGQLDDRREEEIARIVEVYNALEPDSAANILISLDDVTRVLVAERLPSRKLAAILAEMAPQQAAALTMQMHARAAPPETANQLRERLDETATR